MGVQNFKQYSVIIDGGTGVLFQPMTQDYFYILTAKHNLQNKQGNGKYVDKEDNSKINIVWFMNEGGNWNFKNIPFELIKGQNYFPNSNSEVDSAILKIELKKCPGIEIENIYVSYDVNINNDAFLCGFPKDKRDANVGDYQKQYSNYNILRNTNESEFLQSVHINGNQNQNTIIGMSGGGIIKLINGKYELLGIQSQFTRTISEQSEVDFIPIKFFNQIIEENPENLESLLPPYMASFESLRCEIIKLGEIIPALKPKLTNAINEQLKEIQTSPIEICKKSILTKFLTKNTFNNNSNSKELWATCLEYLFILSLIKDKVINIDSLLETIDDKRLIYSETDSCWIEILPEILNSDFADLKDNSILIVGTKTIPGSKRRLNAKAIINNIADPQTNLTIDRVTSIKKIKEIIHIKAIEMDCFVKNEDLLNEFDPFQIEELITQLKKIVYEFLEN